MNFRAFILDLDGVVYIGDEVIEGVPEKIKKLRQKGRVVFLTNNSTKSREDYARKLLSFGIEASPEDIITSGYAAALYLREKFGSAGVFVVGEAGLRKELEDAGHRLCFRGCEAVVVGLDREFNYSKLSRASRLIREGAEFVATNLDSTLITPSGLIPGAGAIVAAVREASGKDPVVVGKPSKTLGKLLLNVLNIKPEDVLLIGDRIETDIAFGKAMGFKTALVLTGISREEDVEKSSIKPDFVLERL